MRHLITRLARLFRTLTAAFDLGQKAEADSRRVLGNVGPLARRHLRALSRVLRDDEWEQVTAIGSIEAGLMEIRDRLRLPAGGSGRAGQVAQEVGHELDAVLSESDGLIASTLLEFPARDESRAAGAIMRLRLRGEGISRRALDLLDAVARAEDGRLELSAVRDQFQRNLPESCVELGLDALERRLDDATTRASAERTLAALRDCRTMLTEREAALTAEIAQYHSALRRIGARSGAEHVGERSFESIEQAAVALREDVRLAGRDAVSGAQSDTAGVAGRHAAHMSVGEAAAMFDIAEEPEVAQVRGKSRHPYNLRREMLSHWSELRSFRVTDPAAVAAAAEIRAHAPEQIVIWPEGAGPKAEVAGQKRRTKRSLKPGALETLARRAPSPDDVVPEHTRRKRGSPGEQGGDRSS